MNYSLKPLSKICSVTGDPLTPGDLCYSVLIEKNGRYERLDFASEAWQGVPDGAIGVWRTEVPFPEVQPTGYVDLDQLFDQFADYCEQANDYQKKLQYVMALYLIRKKRLIHEQTDEQDGVSILHLQGARGEGQFSIEEQQLTESEMQSLQAAIQTVPDQPSQQAA